MSNKNDLDIRRGKIANAGFYVSDDANPVNCDADCECQNDFLKFKIRSEIDEDSFVRAVWIYLAKMDVPFDVFNCDLDCIEKIEHQVMMDTVNVAVEYEAASSKERYGRSVKSERIIKSTACIENGKGEVFASGDESFGLGEEEESKAIVFFDADAFLECFENVSAESIFPADSYVAEQTHGAEDSRREVAKKHKENISKAAGKSLGENYRITERSAEAIESSTYMIMAPEYYTTITYNGKVYTLKAFPFGDGKVSGERVENGYSLSSYIDKRQEKLKMETEEIQKSADKDKSKWNRAPFIISAVLFSLFVAGLVALGIVYAFNGVFMAWNGYSIGMVVGAIAAVLLFVGSVCIFVMNIVLKTRRDMAIDAKARTDIEAKEEAVASDVERFSASYKARQLELLNEKLEFLGLEPVTADELYKLEG